MRRCPRFALGSALCLSLVGLSAAIAGSQLTVGDFALKMALAMKLTAPEGGFNAESATAALRDAGVVLKGDFDSELNEGGLVQALNQVGLKLTTSSPDRIVSEPRADKILRAFEGNLAEARGVFRGKLLCKGGSNDGGKCRQDSQCPGGQCLPAPRKHASEAEP